MLYTVYRYYVTCEIGLNLCKIGMVIAPKDGTNEKTEKFKKEL